MTSPDLDIKSEVTAIPPTAPRFLKEGAVIFGPDIVNAPYPELRCVHTKNQCGTDTWVLGQSCQCENCQAWLKRSDSPFKDLIPVDPAVEAGIHDALKSQGASGIVLGMTPDHKIIVKLATQPEHKKLETVSFDLTTEEYDGLVKEGSVKQIKKVPQDLLVLPMPGPIARRRERFSPPVKQGRRMFRR